MFVSSRTLVVALLMLTGFFIYFFMFVLMKTQPDETLEISKMEKTDPLNTTFTFSGEPITLTEGIFERPVAPGSASREIFRAFGAPEYADIDGDGDEDAVLYLTRESGGTGTYFYIGAALKDGTSYQGTNAMFLGDRIAPQTIEIRGGEVIANFAERYPGEDFSVPPSLGRSVWIHYDPQTEEIGELVRDFEGESDDNRVSLSAHSWEWIRSEVYGTVTTPESSDTFTLSFIDDSHVSVGTDCNSMGGTYELQGYSLTFGSLVSTLMYCENSQESTFASMLAAVHHFEFNEHNELVLSFGKEGRAIFVPIKESPVPVSNPPQTPPVEIDPVSPPQKSGECFVGGCSGQLCTDRQDAISTCEWSAVYACYRTAVCERQASGECGWTETPELMSCIESAGVTF